jgi:hypothetical protein
LPPARAFLQPAARDHLIDARIGAAIQLITGQRQADAAHGERWRICAPRGTELLSGGQIHFQRADGASHIARIDLSRSVGIDLL